MSSVLGLLAIVTLLSQTSSKSRRQCTLNRESRFCFLWTRNVLTGAQHSLQLQHWGRLRSRSAPEPASNADGKARDEAN